MKVVPTTARSSSSPFTRSLSVALKSPPFVAARPDDRPAAVDVIIFATWPVPDTPPDWRVQPKPGDFAVTASPAPWRSGKPGHALMNCGLGRLGDLHDCAIVSQSPPGLGYGQMTLQFASYLRFKPASLAGKPIPVGLSMAFYYPAQPIESGK